jgi:hypothetical protein
LAASTSSHGSSCQGDDRTGAVAAGETIRINGKYFDEFERIAVFALIYDGVPDWSHTDGVVRMNIPGQPEIEVRMNEGRNDKRLCGIATIENRNGELKMERYMQYFDSQQPFAESLGYYFNWRSATKTNVKLSVFRDASEIGISPCKLSAARSSLRSFASPLQAFSGMPRLAFSASPR